MKRGVHYLSEEPKLRVGLRGLSGFFFFRLFGLSACTQFGLLALVAASRTLRGCDDINDDFAVVLAALWACAVREARGATFALREALTRYSVVVAPHCGLRAILAHSDYHIEADYTDFESTCNLEQNVARCISESPQRAIAERCEAVPYPLWT